MTADIRHKNYAKSHSFSSGIKLGVRKFENFFEFDFQDSLRVAPKLCHSIYLFEPG